MQRKANWMPDANICGFFDSIEASSHNQCHQTPNQLLISIVECILSKGYITCGMTSARIQGIRYRACQYHQRVYCPFGVWSIPLLGGPQTTHRLRPVTHMLVWIEVCHPMLYPESRRFSQRLLGIPAVPADRAVSPPDALCVHCARRCATRSWICRV